MVNKKFKKINPTPESGSPITFKIGFTKNAKRVKAKSTKIKPLFPKSNPPIIF